MRLEDLKRDAKVSGVVPSGPVTILDARWHGSDVVELTYRDEQGNTSQQLLYRENESSKSAR